MFDPSLSLANQLLIIQGKIRNACLPTYKKDLLLEDIGFAISRFRNDDINAVLNSLGVIVGKLFFWQKGACSSVCSFAPLLADIIRLQQALLPLQPPPFPVPPATAPVYGYFYNDIEETIPLEGNIPFIYNGIIVGNIVHTPGSADIFVNESGDYQVIYTGMAHNVAQFGIFLNNVEVPGSIHGVGSSNIPIYGFVITRITAPSVLHLRNHTSYTPIVLPVYQGGTAATINASLRIVKIS